MKEAPRDSSKPRSQVFGLGMVLVSFLFFALLPNPAKIAYQEGATRAAMISILEPLLTIVIAILLAGEWLTATQ